MSSAQASAGLLTPTAVKTGPYNAVPGDFVAVDTTSGSVTVTLPTTPPDATRIGVKMVTQGSTNTVTISAGGSDVFNKAGGSTTLTLTLLGQGVLLQYSAAQGGLWFVHADDLPLSQLDSRYIAQSSLPLAIGSGGTGAATQQAALDAVAGAVTNNQVLAGNGNHVTLRALAGADLPAANTSTQGAVILDGTAGDIQALGAQAAGNSTKAAAANHVHPTTGVLVKVADAGNSGVALINGTQTFCSYTTPNDGNLHPVVVMFDLVVGSTQTGGATGVTFTDAGGNVRTAFQILAGAQATGLHLWGFNNFLAAANTSFAVVQTSAQTGGTSTAYVQVFAA